MAQIRHRALKTEAKKGSKGIQGYGKLGIGGRRRVGFPISGPTKIAELSRRTHGKGMSGSSSGSFNLRK